MSLNWQQMGCCEPVWYRAQHASGELELHMTWTEDEWLVCDEQDVLKHTGTTCPVEAQKIAESWFLNTTVNAQPSMF